MYRRDQLTPADLRRLAERAERERWERHRQNWIAAQAWERENAANPTEETPTR